MLDEAKRVKQHKGIKFLVWNTNIFHAFVGHENVFMHHQIIGMTVSLRRRMSLFVIHLCILKYGMCERLHVNRCHFEILFPRQPILRACIHCAVCKYATPGKQIRNYFNRVRVSSRSRHVLGLYPSNSMFGSYPFNSFDNLRPLGPINNN